MLDGVRFLCGFLFDGDNQAHERLVIGFLSFSGCYFIGLLSIGLLSDLFEGCKLCLQFECGRIASAAEYIRIGAYMFMKGCSGAWVKICRHSSVRKCHNYRLVIPAILGKLSQDTV